MTICARCAVKLGRGSASLCMRCYGKARAESAAHRYVCPVCSGAKSRRAAMCLPCRHTAKQGAGNPNFREGRVVNRGYIRVLHHGHPWPRRARYMFEHVRVMELEIGRRIAAGEVVHHKDGDKQNNALTNLELMTNSKHVAMHRAQVIA